MQKIVLFLTLVFVSSCSLVADEEFENLEGKSVEDALADLGSNDNYDNWDERDVPQMGDPDYYATVYSRGHYRDEAPRLPQIVFPRIAVLVAQNGERQARREQRRRDRRERRYDRQLERWPGVTWAK